jgi:hypothetical protein
MRLLTYTFFIAVILNSSLLAGDIIGGGGGKVLVLNPKEISDILLSNENIITVSEISEKTLGEKVIKKDGQVHFIIHNESPVLNIQLIDGKIITLKNIIKDEFIQP